MLALNYFPFVSDETGVYPITQEYSAECGYTVSVLPLTGQVELRASYFSCHTDNKVHSNAHTQHTGVLWLNENKLKVILPILFFYTPIQDDEVFTFNFNLISNHEGKEVTYALNKTCTPSLPWSPREVICETNYIEVSSFIFFNTFFYCVSRCWLILISL